MHRSRSQVAEELFACIRCNECLAACPALPELIPIETLNRETLGEYVSPEVQRFAEGCYQCGACVPVCPVGLHRDAMMLWLKMRLLRRDLGTSTGNSPMPASLPKGRSARDERVWNLNTRAWEPVNSGTRHAKHGRTMPWR